MPDILNELSNINHTLQSIERTLNEPFKGWDEEKRHKENVRVYKQTMELSKWLLMATILISLTSTIQIMEKWGAKPDILNIIYLVIIILTISLMVKVFMIIFSKGED